MTDDVITIEVDGKSFAARKGQMLIEVTDANDIYVPRFCYHNKLSVAANCRMCLVDVEKAPKPLPACATPVMDGMKVRTRSALALDAQKAVMEFLLINHPLDCPICDQGGECELQDLAMGYGSDVSRYQESKRVVKDKNIGPLVQTEMTRCIHCTRCVRFGEEIAGLRELGVTGRGEDMEIGTYVEKSMVSELSGNVIDLCPVGALTSKPFRFSARTWEMQQRPGIATHDCVGSNIEIHIKGDSVKRVVPAANESINEVWLSDRDRFSYEGLNSEARLSSPMIKEDGQWRTVDWSQALEYATAGIQQVVKTTGPQSLGALISPSATVEEGYLLQKLLRGLGSNNIDHRLRQRDFRQQESFPIYPSLGQSIRDLQGLDSVLLIGSHVRQEQPLLNHRLRKASMKGAKIFLLNALDHEFNFPVAEKLIASPSSFVEELCGVTKALSQLAGFAIDDKLTSMIESTEAREEHTRIAQGLLAAQNGTVLLGNSAFAHLQFSSLITLLQMIVKHTNLTLGFLTEGANAAGAWLAGAIPHRMPVGEATETPGLNAYQMLEQGLKGYVLYGIEPELDCWDGRLALSAMQQADFVVCFSAFQSDTMQDYANVILPLALFAETDGTFFNIEGTAQAFTAAVKPIGESRPGWRILRVLANDLQQDGFDYQTIDDVRAEIFPRVEGLAIPVIEDWPITVDLATFSGTYERITDIPMNSVDPLVRHATALSQTIAVADDKVHLNANLADTLNLKEGDRLQVSQDENRIELSVRVDARVPDGCVLVHAAHPATVGLGACNGPVELHKV